MKSGEIAPVTRSGTLLVMLYQRRHLTDCNLKRALEYVCNLDHTYFSSIAVKARSAR
jgi:hypothetical protein